MMRILLNGDPHDLPGPLTVRALLDRLDLDPRVVAVELNRTVVKRGQYSETTIEDGAEVEIVAFVGGGVGEVRSTKFEVRSTAPSSGQDPAGPRRTLQDLE